MVLEIRIEANEGEDDVKFGYNVYNVHTDNHRILSIVTESDDNLTKWLNDVQKYTIKKKKNRVVVGVSFEHETREYRKSGLRDKPFDLMTLCIGSQCLMFEFEHQYDETPKSLRAFFQDPRVFAVGINMESVAKTLERQHQIKMSNPIDLHKLGIERLDNIIDERRFDFDKLTKTVLGDHMVVVRPQQQIHWFDYHYRYGLSMDKVQYATIDAYLYYLLGSDLLDRKLKHTDHQASSSFTKTTSNNKKNKKH